MSEEAAKLSHLLTEAIGSKMQHHRQQEQQQVDALLASQKHLTSNLRTLINSLDTVLQLSTPRYNSSQGDQVSSCANRARSLGSKLDLVAARLARIQEHLQQQEAELGLTPPQAAAATAGGATAASPAVAAADDNAPSQQPQEQQQQQEQQEEQEQQQQEEEQEG